MRLDIPDAVRNYALAEGCAAWLDELPALVQSLADDWSLRVGPTLHGGHAAFVAEVARANGTRAVLKVGVPTNRRQLERETAVLRLTDGEACAQLYLDDLDRGALLIERLGSAMYEVVAGAAIQHDMLCDLATRVWRPVEEGLRLPTGADRAGEYGEQIPRLWELLGRPCSRAAIDDAIGCAERRRRAHDDRLAVLVHGDVHNANALLGVGDTFKLIDPDGLRAERACDLGTILRCNPELGDDLRARAYRLAARTGVDAIAIWEWGTIYRVIGGLHSRRVGFQPFGDHLLAHADRLANG